MTSNDDDKISRLQHDVGKQDGRLSLLEFRTTRIEDDRKTERASQRQLYFAVIVAIVGSALNILIQFITGGGNSG